MKLFGSKGGDEAEETSDTAEGTEEIENAGGDEGEAPAAEDSGAAEAPSEESGAAEPPPEEGGDEPLSAPARALGPIAAAGKKKLIALAAVLAVSGLGAGGYFYFMGDTTPALPLHPVVPAKTAAAPAPAAPGAPHPAAAAAFATAPVQAPPTAVTAMSPGAPPALAAPGAAAAPAGLPAAVGAQSTGPTGISAAKPGATAAPIPETTVTASVSSAPALGAPPVEEASAIQMPNGQMPNGQMPNGTSQNSQPAGPATAGTAASSAGVPNAGGKTDGAMEPPQDLPLPVDMGAPASSGGSTGGNMAPGATSAGMGAAAPGNGAPAVAGGANGQKPSAAETAIVQNAAVLDQLSQPPNGQAAPARPFDPNRPPPNQADALKTVDQLLEQQAVVRPIPPQWLVVKKDINATSADSRLAAAREALAQNNNTAALELFDEISKDNPKDKRILMGKAVALQKLGQADEALAAYEDVLNADPKNLEALTNMLGLLKAKDPQLAVDKLTELREAYPYQPDITAQLGIACAAAGQYDNATRYLDMAEALNPGSVYIAYNKAVLYDKMGKVPQAIQWYQKVLRMAAEGHTDQPLPLDEVRNRLAVLR